MDIMGNILLADFFESLWHETSFHTITEHWGKRCEDFLKKVGPDVTWTLDEFLYLVMTLEFKKKLSLCRGGLRRAVDIVEPDDIPKTIEALNFIYQKMTTAIISKAGPQNFNLRCVDWIEMANKTGYPLETPITQRIRLSHFALTWEAIDGLDPGELLGIHETINLVKKHAKNEISVNSLLTDFIKCKVGVYIRREQFNIPEPNKIYSNDFRGQSVNDLEALRKEESEAYVTYTYSFKNLIRLIDSHSTRCDGQTQHLKQDVQQLILGGEIRLGGINNMLIYLPAFSDLVLGYNPLHKFETNETVTIKIEDLFFRRQDIMHYIEKRSSFEMGNGKHVKPKKRTVKQIEHSNAAKETAVKSYKPYQYEALRLGDAELEKYSVSSLAKFLVNRQKNQKFIVTSPLAERTLREKIAKDRNLIDKLKKRKNSN